MTRAEAAFAACLARLAGLRLAHDKPEETPEATARALCHLAAGAPLSMHAALELPLPVLDEAAERRLHALVEQRLAGVPLAYLTGVQRFMGLDLIAGKAVLIPRKETELLGYAALERLRAMAVDGRELAVLDLCTGSGNLAVALAHHLPAARLYGSDLSEDAVQLARRNAAQAGVAARVEIRQGDLLAPFDEGRFDDAFDAILCNPPYISTAKVAALPSEISRHEPNLAFDGGPYGINFLLRLIGEAPRFLRPAGMLAFEVGLGQGPALIRRLSKRGLNVEQTVCDGQGEIRALIARR